MARGLEKNSPIVLKLTKDNYDALIERHGQWVRWLMAQKCTCVLSTGRVDYNCQRCGGDGWLYSYQTEKAVTAKCKVVSDNVVELPCDYGTARMVIGVKGLQQYEPIALLSGKFIQVNGNLKKNEVVFADYIESIKKTETVPCVYEGSNRFSIFSKWGKRLNDRTIQPDIVSVKWIKNWTNGELYVVKKVFRSMIEVNTPSFAIQETDRVEAEIEVIEPKLLLLLNQNFIEIDQRFLTEVGGNGILVFPSEYHVSEGDVVVALVAEMIGKTIITRSSSQEDKIPAWYVTKILSIAQESGEVDPSLYALRLYNRVVWKDNPGVPPPGTNLSITFRYNPVYRVIQEMPVVRSSENQQIARRVALKLLTMGGAEAEGI